MSAARPSEHARAAAFRLLALVAATVATMRAAGAQSLLERTPNMQGAWTLPRWSSVFVLTHRFELLDGGDELFNVPALTLAIGLPWRLTAGLDYTSNSETVDARLSESEASYWLKAGLPIGSRGAVALVGAYNSLAESMDGAATGRVELGPVALTGEVRAFSDRWGSGESGSAVAGGALLRLTPRLALVGDVGRAIDMDTLETTWSAGVALAIPGSPHTFSLFATNTGATSLQSASRAKVFGPEEKRWGFSLTVPLGSRAQWGQVLRRDAPAPAATSGDTVRVMIRQVAFGTPLVRIRPGQVVEWVNADPIEHTATANDGKWDSGMLPKDGRWARRFDAAGRYEYHCRPHPQMRGVVVVEESPGS